MNIIKKIVLLTFLFTFLLVQFTCGSVIARESMTLTVSHVLAPTNPYQFGFERMAEIVEEKTNGEIKFNIFHSASLAEEEQAIEALQMGTIDITTVSAAPLTAFVKEFMACDFPFMFSSSQEAFDFYDGEIGDILLEKTEEVGLIGLCWWENGFRNLTNDVRPIVTPEDLKGLKIRTMYSPVHMASIEALGGSVTPISYGELYSALQQGVIDGQENPVSNIYQARFYEVQKHLTLSRHFHDPSPTFISAKTWEKLNEEQRKIIKEASIEARDYMRQLGIDAEDSIIEELKKEGMEVTELTPEQLNAFKEATKDVWRGFEDEIGKEFLEKFLNALP
jgi:TRAP-type transport system periplasmic protein